VRDKCIHDLNEMLCRLTQSIQLPYHQHIARSQVVYCSSLVNSGRSCLEPDVQSVNTLWKPALLSAIIECIVLQGGILISSTDPGVADGILRDAQEHKP